ncbi:MAG: hypothetical protein HC905_15680 [Bacteroidales bacterium]|nr:hypothetical protein [Bacteroidales bacterium]
MLNRWTPTNENTNIPKAIFTGSRNNYGSNLNDFFVEDASYIRLKNVTLTYHYPKELLAKSAHRRYGFSLVAKTWQPLPAIKALIPMLAVIMPVYLQSKFIQQV